MRTFKLLFLSLLAFSQPVAGREFSAVTLFDQVQPPRSQALGGAATALGQDTALLLTNPASLDATAASEVVLGIRRGIWDDVGSFALAGVPSRLGTFAVGCFYLDGGRITLNSSDGSSRTVNARQDVAACLSYAVALSPAFSGGITCKALHSRLLEEYGATAVAFDGGVCAKVGDQGSVGLALRNVGSGLRYSEDRVALGSVACLGIAWCWTLPDLQDEGRTGGPANFLHLLAGGEEPLDERIIVWKAGCELNLGNQMALRVGAQLSREQAAGLSGGIGLRPGRYCVDYAIQSAHAGGLQHTVSLAVSLGKLGRPFPDEQETPPSLDH